jgi:uncharacterized protein YdaT
MATIGNLSVVIDADTTGLASGLATANKHTNEFQNKLGALADKLKVVGPIAAAAGAAFALNMVKSVADAADALGDLSERTGIAVEDLSRLQYMAQLSGSSAESMNAAIIKLSKGMADGNPAFEAMGVAVKNADGSLRSQSDVLNDIADKFTTYRDGTAKAALAMQLFGKSGAEMVGVLNQGSAGIKALADESDRLGNTISTKTAQQAARFNDNLDKLSVAAGGVARTISGPLIEALADLTGGLFEAYMQGETLFGSFERGFKRMAQAKDINTAKERVDELQAEYNALMESMAHLEPWEQASMGAMTLAQRLSEAKARYSELTQLSENFRGKGFQDPRAVGTIQDGKTNAPVVDVAASKAKEDAAKARADELEQIREHELAKVQAFIDALKLREEARIQATQTEQEQESERYTLEQEKLLEALELGLITKGEYQLMEQEALLAHREAMADIDIQYLNDQAAREKAAADERVRIERDAQQLITDARLSAANAAVGLLAQLGGKNKAAAIAAIALGKALSIGQIMQNTAVAQMKALAMLGPIAGPPAAAKIGMYGKIQAGIVAATGLAQVAGVMSGDGGGSLSVGGGGSSGGGVAGGSSGGDGLVGAASVPQGQTVTIQLDGEIFGREQVRSLITQINEAVADGSVLRIA